MERKRFKIPNQIDSSLHVWRFVKLKDLAFLVPPILLSVALFQFLESFDFEWRFGISVFPIVSIACLILIHPVRERKNLTLFDVFKAKIEYNNRPRMYYYDKK